MSQPYLGEIRMFAGNFALKNNAFCNGQPMSIQQNTALFSLLGTFYGGDGVTTFALPDLRGRLPVSMGQGNGLSNYNIGEAIGTESVTLAVNQLPAHNHMMLASTAAASLSSPVGNTPAALADPFTGLWVAPGKAVAPPFELFDTILTNTGSNQPHENRMAGLAISMLIALTGIFPSRN